VAAARPDAESTLTTQTIGCAWAALLALAVLVPKRTAAVSDPKPPHTATARWLIAGALLVGGPATALFLAARDLDSGALTIALALTPVVIAIASPALGSESSEGIAGRIWPGLASVAGLLLVLVQPDLGDLRTDLALVLAPALTGIGAVLFCMGPPRTRSRIPSTLLGACILFALALAASVFIAHVRPPFSLLAVAGDGALALLSVITLNQLGAARWSSQFAWVPLMIILEGIVLVHAHLTANWFTGLILLIVAGTYLLMPQGNESTPETSPVPITRR
jgi:drug/metabolite transporter (DMT)-like permease